MNPKVIDRLLDEKSIEETRALVRLGDAVRSTRLLFELGLRFGPYRYRLNQAIASCAASSRCFPPT